jgi:sulfopyruvate decarboxylase subunit beta
LFEGLPRGDVISASPDHFNWIPGNKNDHAELSTIECLDNKSDPELLKTRYDALSILADQLKNKAIICNMGFPSRELYSILDQESNFYMLGSLGLVSSIGLGIALFTKKQVIVVDGDGSLLMNPNTLFLIGALKPDNLTILCLDNGTYGSTGDQPTLSSYGLKLDELAKACNFQRVVVCDDPGQLSDQFVKGTNFIRLLIKPGNAKVGTIGLQPLLIKDRFMKWLNE